MQITPLTPPAPLDAETLAALAELDRLKAELDALRPLDPTAEGRVLQKLRLDWNYHSNAIEGNQLSQGETRALLMHGLTAHGKPLKDHNEIKGHNEVIEWLEDVVRNQEPLTEAMLREFHKRLLVEAYELDALTPDGQPSRRRIEPGTYKTQPNHVQTATGAIHYYADPAEVPALMGDLMAWYRARSEQRDLHPVIVAAELHYWFVAIHPFDDGNGRLSRILLNLELMRHGYPIAVIRTKDKPAYLTALETADATTNLSDFYSVIIESVRRNTIIIMKAAKGEDYREPDEIADFDKEIALVEFSLKSLEENYPTKTSYETKKISKIFYENFIEKNMNSFDFLNKFYNKKASSFYFNKKINKTQIVHTKLEDVNKNMINLLDYINNSEEIQMIRANIIFYDFKFRGAPFLGVNPKIEIDISIEFSEHNYVINISGLSVQEIKKYYYNNLPDTSFYEQSEKKIKERVLSELKAVSTPPPAP